MNKSVLAAVGVLVAGGAVAAVILMGGNNKDSTNNQSRPSSSTPAQSPNSAPQTSNPQQADTSEVKQGNVAVEIKDFAFSPSTLKVKKGTTITWTNQDTVGHTVTSDSGNTLNSELLGKGQSFSFTFNELGTFSYHCTPHPQMMAGVEVVE